MKNNTQEIYIHIPFCERKCDYCDFVSFVCDEDTKKHYFSRLIEQIDKKSEFTGKVPVDSVFFGGGTPSSVDAGLIDETLNHLRKKYMVTDDAEITIEMNPNSVTSDKLKIYKTAGINRISIGLQSANDEELRVLSRLHDYRTFLKTYEMVRNEGFRNVNIDIMSALPGQDKTSYMRTLEKVVELNPEHISAYSLIIEEGTKFHDRYESGEGLPDEETDREMYHDTKLFLSENGYHRYEISNYSKPGFECRHNTGYWTGKKYVGFGPAAASFDGENRYQMHNSLTKYLAGDFSEDIENLSDVDKMEEFMFLGLRLTAGVSLEEFQNRFGKDIWSVYKKPIDKLMAEGLMKLRDNRLYLTDFGMDISNYCMAEFII